MSKGWWRMGRRKSQTKSTMAKTRRDREDGTFTERETGMKGD